MSKTEQAAHVPIWRKSSFSVNAGACAEVAAGSGVVMVRDSNTPAGPPLQFPAKEWRRFIARTKEVTA
jgi:Domain of unknown function (DUF397)